MPPLVSWCSKQPVAESAAPFSTHSVSGLSCAGRSLAIDKLGNWKEPGSLDVDERVVRSATFEFSGETLVEVEEAGDTLREAPTSICFCRFCFASSNTPGFVASAPAWPIFSNSSVSVSDSKTRL